MRKTNELQRRMLRKVSVIALMIVCFVMFSVTTYAAEGRVKASAAKIRKDASTSSEAIGSAVNGQTFEITNEVTGADGRVWYQISFDGNKTGYIRSDLMDKKEEPITGGDINPSVEVEEVQPVSAKISGNTVRVRSDATTEGSTIVANVVKDSVVTITGRAKDNQSKTWYLVSFSTDTGEVKGFIREDFLTVSGEVTPIPDAPVEIEPPVENEPVVDEGTQQPPVITDKYYIKEKEGEFYLVDSEAGMQYSAESLIKAAISNLDVIAERDKTIDKQKIWLGILVILVVVLGVLCTILFLKVREVMDDAYFAAIEKETIRQRQGQKANNPSAASKNKTVMHTVGAGPNKQGGQNRPATAKPAQQRPAVQNVRPAEAGEAKNNRPVGSQKPVGNASGQKSVNVQNRPENPEKTVANKNVVPTPQTVKASPQKNLEEPKKQNWQSKNFAAEEEEEFEFEFLNWDGSEDE